ncbi:MAG: hypothetical protein AAF171_27505 [Cyanobacteria bacterium P01_A01_bin.116]
MLSGIKRQSVVGKNGKIEIQAAELAEGTVVEVIVLTNSNELSADVSQQQAIPEDTTEYLLSTEANRRHLMTSIRQAEAKEGLATFTAKEWDEEYNVHP